MALTGLFITDITLRGHSKKYVTLFWLILDPLPHHVTLGVIFCNMTLIDTLPSCVTWWHCCDTPPTLEYHWLLEWFLIVIFSAKMKLQSTFTILGGYVAGNSGNQAFPEMPRQLRESQCCLGNCGNTRHFRKCLGNWGIFEFFYKPSILGHCRATKNQLEKLN